MSWLSSLIIVALLCALIKSTLTVFQALRFDAHGIRVARHRRLQPHARRYRQRPAVGVIIICDDDTAKLEASLNSLQACRYKQLQIIVSQRSLSGKPNQSIRHLVSSYNASLAISYQYTQRPQPLSHLLKKAVKALSKVDLVVPIESGTTLGPSALREVVIVATLDESVQIITPDRIHRREDTIGSFLTQYYNLLQRRSMKAQSAQLVTPQSSLANVIYRRDVLTKLLSARLPKQLLRCQFAPRARMTVPASSSITAALLQPTTAYQALFERYAQLLLLRADQRSLLRLGTYLFNLVAVAGRLLISVLCITALYLAIQLHQPALAILAASCFASLMLLAISDAPLKPLEKSQLALLAPPFLLMLFVAQVVALVWLPLMFMAKTFVTARGYIQRPPSTPQPRSLKPATN